MTATTSRDGVSIVCVFNDPAVRRECLDRSVERYQGPVPVDYIPVDNTEHAFSTAGAALNHGARQARHRLVVFVHQDVYLHSIDRLVEAGRAFDDDDDAADDDEGRWGILGANGVTAQGLNVGRLRDRTQLIGAPAPHPVEVQTLDEVLFMVPRELVLEHPLSELPDLAWHAYGVEYSLRVVELGRRAGAVDLAVTHNSLTINMARLDVAHRNVGELYPARLPIHTTCGVVGSRRSRLRSRSALVRRHGWRLRWARHSLLAARARRRLDLPVVLSDIRADVDLLPIDPDVPLRLVNVDAARTFAEYGRDPVRLTRHGRAFVMSATSSVGELATAMDVLGADEPVLVVGLTLDDLSELGDLTSSGRPWVIGIHPQEMWLLGGISRDRLPEAWSHGEAVPFRLRRAVVG